MGLVVGHLVMAPFAYVGKRSWKSDPFGQSLPMVLFEYEGVRIGDPTVGGGDVNPIHLSPHL